MKVDPNKVWTVKWGIHRNTFTSRDTGDPMIRKTEAEAREAHRRNREHFNRMGCKIWFAYLEHPDGTEELLEQNGFVGELADPLDSKSGA